MPALLTIIPDDLQSAETIAFLAAHVTEMRAVSPPRTGHVLDLDGLRHPDITFWTARQGDSVVGCGALREIDPTHGEIKSMRTDATLRGQGVGSQLLQHIIREARQRGYHRLSLETGSYDFFAAARAFYRKHGFIDCGPFGTYTDTPVSAFMTLDLAI